MAIPSFEIEVALGTTKKFRGQLKDEETGDAQALSTMTKIWLTGKLSVEDDDDDALINLYWPGGGGTTIDAVQGIVEWKIPASATNSLDIRVYDLITDIKGLDTSSDPWQLTRGLITLTPEIHQGVS